MENNIDNDFKDINKESFTKQYIIVGILYAIVILLSVLLILGLKKQKEVINDNYNDKIEPDIKEEIDSIEDEKNTEDNINNDENINKTEEDTEDSNNKKEENNINDDLIDGGLNILDQLR